MQPFYDLCISYNCIGRELAAKVHCMGNLIFRAVSYMGELAGVILLVSRFRV